MKLKLIKRKTEEDPVETVAKANKIPLLDNLALTYIPPPGAAGKDGETVDSVVMDASAGVSKNGEDKEPIEQRI